MSQSMLETWGPTAVDVVTVLAAAGIAVWGSIRGAREGAKQGADVTRAATQQQIDAQQEAARKQRQREDRAALRASATECRINANLLRQQRHYWPDPRLLAPLGHVAFDAATPCLADLPADARRNAQAVFTSVLWFNRLVAARLVGMREEGDTVARNLLLELEELANELSPQLDDIATSFENEASRAEQ